MKDSAGKSASVWAALILFIQPTTIAAGSSAVEPGLVPAAPIALSCSTFSAAADEAGISRSYGGIHFIDGDVNGRKVGRKVGKQAFEKAQKYINGTIAE